MVDVNRPASEIVVIIGEGSLLPAQIMRFTKSGALATGPRHPTPLGKEARYHSLALILPLSIPLFYINKPTIIDRQSFVTTHGIDST
jgi:hypothetical protein